MSSFEDKILRLFINKFGLTANLPEFYLQCIDGIFTYMENSDMFGSFSDFHVIDPDITPIDAIKMKISYMYAIQCTFTDKHNNSITDILFNIPKIVYEDRLQYRGYFIIDGLEKFPSIQSTISKNFFNLQNNICTTRIIGNKSSFSVRLENNRFMLCVDTKCIDIVSVINTLGYEIDVIETVLKSTNLAHDVIETCYNIILYCNKISHESGVLSQDIVDGCFNNLTEGQIVSLISYMLYLLAAKKIGYISNTDLSHYENKTFRTYGQDIKNIVCRAFNNVRITDDMTANTAFYKIKQELLRNINEAIIEKYKSGVLVIFGKQYQDMVSTVSRRSHIDSITTMRRVTIPTISSSKNVDIRQSHVSQMGFVCPVETPESTDVGLSLTLSMLCIISEHTNDDLVENMIDTWTKGDYYTIYCINNKIVSTKATNIYQQLLHLKKSDKRFQYISVIHDGITIIRTTAGRLMKPVYVGNNTIDIFEDTNNWDDLYGKIMFIDAAESTRNKYTELHPCFMVGLSTLSIPLANHNQGARAVFGTSMSKQSMQTYVDEYDIERKSLTYAQSPILTTVVDRIIRSDLYPGVNMCVAIYSDHGFNQEDSIIIRQGFIDKIGKICCNTKIVEVVLELTDEVVIIPETDNQDYVNGIVDVNTLIVIGQILLAFSKKKSGVTVINEIKSKVHGRVSNIEILKNKNSVNKVYRITVCEYRSIQIGDKIASRHAQKGIISRIIPDTDCIITLDGLIPDIIINPHAIPSRMTIGQIIESSISVEALNKGIHVNGTIFTKDYVEYLTSNEEYVISGVTGELISNPINIGMVYYYILAHQAVDKIQHRSWGENSMMSLQPVSGKSRKGGLRVGEMEIDAILAHGASYTINAVLEESDMINVYLCNNCGYILSSGYNCDNCNHATTIERVPYAIKNITNILQLMSITTRANM